MVSDCQRNFTGVEFGAVCACKLLVIPNSGKTSKQIANDLRVNNMTSLLYVPMSITKHAFN
jgi:hypothetical protein